jgi:hypothetical protein
MHAAHHFHVNLGDLPTWLAVIFAAAVALSQLRGQQKELTRQLAALERQQADQVDMYASSQVRRLPGDEPGKTVQTSCWDMVVSNASRRPIRNVEARIDATGSGDLSAPDWSGWGAQDEPTFGQSKDGKATITLLRAEHRAVFAFPHPTREFPDARVVTRFTDDAGLYWQIGHDMHLARLNKRDW